MIYNIIITFYRLALGLWKGHQLIAKIERFYLQDGLKFALGPMGRAIIALTFKEVDLVLSTQKVITKHQKKHQKFHHNKHLPSSICHYTTTFFREINFKKNFLSSNRFHEKYYCTASQYLCTLKKTKISKKNYKKPSRRDLKNCFKKSRHYYFGHSICLKK